MGDVLANTWDASWEDAKTGKPMLGRGTEIWVVRGDRIALVGCDVQCLGKGRPAESRRWYDAAPGSGVSPSPYRLLQGEGEVTGRWSQSGAMRSQVSSRCSGPPAPERGGGRRTMRSPSKRTSRTWSLPIRVGSDAASTRVTRRCPSNV